VTTSAHPGTAADGAGNDPAPWVRTRLRSAPLAALLSAALAFGTVFLAAALPRALDRGADQALREYLRSSGPAATSLLATAAPRRAEDETRESLDAVLATLRGRIGGSLRLDPSGPVYGARGLKPRSLANPELSRPDGVPPQLGLLHLPDAAAHVHLVAGRWPTGGTTGPIPVALPASTADTIGARLGSVLDAGTTQSSRQQAEVVGLYTVNDPSDVFWTDLPCLAKACLDQTADRPPQSFWQTAGLVGPESLHRLWSWGEQVEDFWRLPVDTAGLRADRLADTRKQIAGFVAGPAAAELTTVTGRTDLRIRSYLPDLFEQSLARQAAAAPLTAIGPAGLAGVAALVLCLAAALAADRRSEELRLLRARGGSRAGILRRLLGEGAVTVVPAASLAALLAFLLLPTPRWTAALLAALASGLLALLAFPVRAAVLLTAPRRRAVRRRLVAELAVLAATVAAVFEVRRRGIAPPGEGLDPLLVAAPLLLALTGALLLARLQPVLVGALARLAGRRPGVVGFLGLARAARGTGGRPRPSVLPMLALMLAVTTAGFGATVLDSVDAARLRVARLAVGGDASVIAPPGATLAQSFTTAAAELPGVRAVTTVRTEDEVTLIGTTGASSRVTVIVADPVSYAELARAVGRGQFDPALLAGHGGPDSPVPALVSTDLADRVATGTYRLLLGGGELRASTAGVVDGTPALPGTGASTVVLPVGPAATRLPELGHPNGWFAIGAIDVARLRALAGGTAPAPPSGGPATAATPGAEPSRYLVRTSAAKAEELAGDPLQRSAGRLFWEAVLGAAGFALLAVLLTLVRAAPERAALLARLRTMGLRPRQGLTLILAEALPQALAAAAGGGLVAAAAVALLGPAVDLSSMVGASVPTGLRPAVLPVLAQTLGLAALVSAGVLAEAAVSGRRQITTELRAGDDR